MRVLVVFANPGTKSFGAALHLKVLETLRSKQHDVDDCDLYAEAFDPVLSPRERDNYHDTDKNCGDCPICGSIAGGGRFGLDLSGLERGLSGDYERFL